MENGYCALRTWFLNTTDCVFGLRPVTAEARVRSKVSKCEILWWTESQLDSFFFEDFGFLVSLSSLLCSIVIFIYTLLLPERQMGEAWETF
jgi:hypothetical protein